MQSKNGDIKPAQNCFMTGANDDKNYFFKMLYIFYNWLLEVYPKENQSCIPGEDRLLKTLGCIMINIANFGNILLKMTLSFKMPRSRTNEPEEKHETVENVNCGVNCNVFSNHIDNPHSRGVEIQTNSAQLDPDQQIANFSMINETAVRQNRKTLPAGQCISSTPFISPASSINQDSLQNEANIFDGKNGERASIMTDASESERQRMIQLNNEHYQTKHQLSSVCVQKSRKIKRLERELEIVKSSWDKEIRYIRYNMEVIRNEIISRT